MGAVEQTHQERLLDRYAALSKTNTYGDQKRLAEWRIPVARSRDKESC